MAIRQLRSRTAETCQEGQDSPAGEEVSLTQCDQPVGLGSVGSESESCEPLLVWQVIQAPSQELSEKESSKVEQMLVGFMAAIQQSLSTNNDNINSIKSDINSVRAVPACAVKYARVCWLWCMWLRCVWLRCVWCSCLWCDVLVAVCCLSILVDVVMRDCWCCLLCVVVRVVCCDGERCVWCGV